MHSSEDTAEDSHLGLGCGQDFCMPELCSLSIQKNAGGCSGLSASAALVSNRIQGKYGVERSNELILSSSGLQKSCDIFHSQIFQPEYLRSSEQQRDVSETQITGVSPKGDIAVLPGQYQETTNGLSERYSA